LEKRGGLKSPALFKWSLFIQQAIAFLVITILSSLARENDWDDPNDQKKLKKGHG
jgi:hypothetical protein